MANETLVPQLRFLEFNGNWKTKEFGNLYDFKTTNSFSRDNLNYENGSVKNIHYGDIHTKFNSQFDITKELVPYINEDIDISRIGDESYLVEGDLVIADASEDYTDIGKSIEIIKLNGEKTVAGLHTILARRKSEDIAIGFASFIMKTNVIRLEVMKMAQGSKVLSISAGRLAKINLLLPEPDEQTKIADFIAKVDNQIQLLEKEKTLLEKYKKGIFQKIFNQEIRFKDDNGNDFPDWEKKKLGEFSKITTGSSNRIDSNLDGEYTFFDRSQDIRSSNRFLFDTEAIIVPGEGQEFIPKYFKGKFDLHQRTYAIMDFGNINGKYLFYSITYNKKHLDSQAVGSTVKSLRLPMFESMPINLPNLEEQSKIANFLSDLDNLIVKNDIQIYMSKSFKKGLLQKMFI